MRFDHIVIHTDNNPDKLRALKGEVNRFGYPFDPEKGRRSFDYRVHNINVGSEYMEIVRLTRPNVQTWMPLWSHYYEQGQRGAYCIFVEVEDVERTAVAIKKAGVAARGPAVLTYPSLYGLLRLETPYFIYYMPPFPGCTLHLALMQYKKPGDREAAQAKRAPNAIDNGIQGIRRVDIELPSVTESLPMLQTIFGNALHSNNGESTIQMEKTRMTFSSSEDGLTHVRLTTITSLRENLGSKFQVDNVEVITGGG